MSIPLLAYYGNWTEPSMYDKYILLEDVYDETACGYVYDGYENYLTVKLMCRKVTQENLIDISLLFRENLQNGIDRLRNAAYTKSYQNNLI